MWKIENSFGKMENSYGKIENSYRKIENGCAGRPLDDDPTPEVEGARSKGQDRCTTILRLDQSALTAPI